MHRFGDCYEGVVVDGACRWFTLRTISCSVSHIMIRVTLLHMCITELVDTEKRLNWNLSYWTHHRSPIRHLFLRWVLELPYWNDVTLFCIVCLNWTVSKISGISLMTIQQHHSKRCVLNIFWSHAIWYQSPDVYIINCTWKHISPIFASFLLIWDKYAITGSKLQGA